MHTSTHNHPAVMMISEPRLHGEHRHLPRTVCASVIVLMSLPPNESLEATVLAERVMSCLCSMYCHVSSHSCTIQFIKCNSRHYLTSCICLQPHHSQIIAARIRCSRTQEEKRLLFSIVHFFSFFSFIHAADFTEVARLPRIPTVYQAGWKNGWKVTEKSPFPPLPACVQVHECDMKLLFNSVPVLALADAAISGMCVTAQGFQPVKPCVCRHYYFVCSNRPEAWRWTGWLRRPACCVLMLETDSKWTCLYKASWQLILSFGTKQILEETQCAPYCWRDSTHCLRQKTTMMWLLNNNKSNINLMSNHLFFCWLLLWTHSPFFH